MDLEAIIREITQEVYSRLAGGEAPVASSKAVDKSEVVYAQMDPHLKLKDVENACHHAVEKRYKTVLLPQWFVGYAHDILGNADVKVATVVGLPGGTTSTFAKYAETKQAVSNGAKVVVIPANMEMLKRGEFAQDKGDLADSLVPTRNKAQACTLIEADALAQDKLVPAAEACLASGVQCVLLSGATADSVRALRSKNMPVGVYGGADSFNQLGVVCHVTSRA